MEGLPRLRDSKAGLVEKGNFASRATGSSQGSVHSFVSSHTPGTQCAGQRVAARQDAPPPGVLQEQLNAKSEENSFGFAVVINQSEMEIELR
jgi:hypothetical protein